MRVPPTFPLPPTFGDISLWPAPRVTQPGDTGRGARGGDNVHAEEGKTPTQHRDSANPTRDPQVGPPRCWGLPHPPGAGSLYPVPAPPSPSATLGCGGCPGGLRPMLSQQRRPQGLAQGPGAAALSGNPGGPWTRPGHTPATAGHHGSPRATTRGHSEPPRVTVGRFQSLWATTGPRGATASSCATSPASAGPRPAAPVPCAPSALCGRRSPPGRRWPAGSAG